MKILINNKQGLNDHAKLNAALHEARGYDIAMYQAYNQLNFYTAVLLT